MAQSHPISVAPDAPALPAFAAAGDAAVRITLLEDREAGERQPALLGMGRLLDPLELGEPARLAVDNGPVLVTGEVLRLRSLGGDALRVETDRSVYRLDLLEPAAA